MGRKGKHLPEEVKRKISKALKGKIPWNKGLKTKEVYSLPWREKHKKSCPNCGKLIHRISFLCKKCNAKELGKKRVGIKMKKYKIRIDRGLPHSKGWNEKVAESQRGAKSHLWKGGLTPTMDLIRHCYKYKLWRQEIFLRDNFTCRECNRNGGFLNAHHKKPFAQLLREAMDAMPLLTKFDAAIFYSPLWNLENGVTLCRDCHDKTKLGIKTDCPGAGKHRQAKDKGRK